MKFGNFKNHKIVRSNPPNRGAYSNYKRDLCKDFGNRCAYCNLKTNYITTTPFEADHFIPRKECKEIRPDLIDDYNNLVYSCKKCNNAKSSQFKGDLSLENPTNELFYDPVQVDYNDVFYRNEIGAIDSDDEKGRDMIKRLKLYRPIHILAWICEQLDLTTQKLKYLEEFEQNPEKKEKLTLAISKLNDKQLSYIHLFISAYNNEHIVDDVFSDINE